jgi:hypothetical protein
MDQANLEATAMTLSRERLHSIMDVVAKKHPLTAEEILDKFSIYNNWPELRRKEFSSHGEGRSDQSAPPDKG